MKNRIVTVLCILAILITTVIVAINSEGRAAFENATHVMNQYEEGDPHKCRS